MCICLCDWALNELTNPLVVGRRRRRSFFTIYYAAHRKYHMPTITINAMFVFHFSVSLIAIAVYCWSLIKPSIGMNWHRIIFILRPLAKLERLAKP